MKKITETDLVGKGVVGQEDTPDLPALEMQYKVEEIAREVIIPAVNAIVEEVQNRYTKTETDEAINAKMVEAGAGDMAKAVYDTDGDGTVDNARKLGGHLPEYYMPAGGGAFTGNTTAYTQNRTGFSLRNITVRTGGIDGEEVSTNSIVLIRK